MKIEKGQSLFEVVMALAVTTIIVVGIVALSVNSVKNANYSRDKTLATRYSEEAIEWLREERDTDFTVFVARVGNWCLPSLDWPSATVGTCSSGQEITDTVFKREIVLSNSLVSGKTVIEATVTVYWQDSQSIHEVNTLTNFTDWREQP